MARSTCNVRVVAGHGGLLLGLLTVCLLLVVRGLFYFGEQQRQQWDRLLRPPEAAGGSGPEPSANPPSANAHNNDDGVRLVVRLGESAVLAPASSRTKTSNNNDTHHTAHHVTVTKSSAAKLQLSAANPSPSKPEGTIVAGGGGSGGTSGKAMNNVVRLNGGKTVEGFTLFHRNVDDRNIDRTYKRLDIGRRFPKYGTPEFSALCPWVHAGQSGSAFAINDILARAMQSATPSIEASSCTILVAQLAGNKQGVSTWFSQIAHGFIHARQAGCKLLVDYNGAVDVDEVLAPVDEEAFDWRVPDNFVCEERNGCFPLRLDGSATIHFPWKGSSGDLELYPSAPNYRWSYGGADKFQIVRSKFDPLQEHLEGYGIENGMGCAIGSLLRYAPSASKFEPRLFSEILPVLQDGQSLVLSLYVRTGRTDAIAESEKAGVASTSNANAERQREDDNFNEHAEAQAYKNIFDCAEKVERDHLNDKDAQFKQVVWLVISDSPSLKHFVANKYDGNIPEENKGDKNEAKIARKVITTNTRGIHTRPQRNPTTDEFAEAVIDWMLIGQSDALVATSTLSFGFTAALRTNRPFFDAGHGCGRRIMVVETEK